MARSQHPYRETATEEVALAPVPTPDVPRWRVAMAVGGSVTAMLGLFLAPAIAFVGALTAAAGVLFVFTYEWSTRMQAIERLQRLPFRIVHDRSDVLDPNVAPRRLLAMTVVLRGAGAGDARLSPPRKPRSLVELAELLSTWGLSVHERYGIAEVAVRWAPRSGPPLSL